MQTKRQSRRSQQRMVRSAFVTQDVEERTRWVLVVLRVGDETATEYRCHSANREGAIREARIMRDVLESRKKMGIVAVGEVVERMKVIEELMTCAPNVLLTGDDEQPALPKRK